MNSITNALFILILCTWWKYVSRRGPIVVKAALLNHTVLGETLSVPRTRHCTRWHETLQGHPTFKKVVRSDPGNYRTVSIWSGTSKVLEKVLHKHLNQYAVDSRLLYEFESGFRKSHWTDSCLQYLTDFIRGELNFGKPCGMILIDLKKAFDTVDHSLLYSKLSALGMSPPTLRWLVFYLSDRSQKMEFQSHLYREQPVTCGVRQGSV